MDISAWDDTICIGQEKNRWKAAKLELSFSSDESVAKLLLDLYCVWIKPRVALKDVFPTSKTEVGAQDKDTPYKNELETQLGFQEGDIESGQIWPKSSVTGKLVNGVEEL